MKKFLLSLALVFGLACSAVETRIYEGQVNGAVIVFGAPIEQTAKIRVELEGDKTATTFKVRGKFLESPAYLSRTNWSNVITAEGVTNNPFRTSFSNKDYLGRCAIYHPEDWSSLTIAASSRVVGIDAIIYQSRLALIETKQGGLSTIKPPIKSLDVIDVTNHKTGYKGGRGARLDLAQITKPAFSAKKAGDKLFFSGANRDGWPRVEIKKPCNGKAWLGWYLADGTLFFGHFDWLSIGQSIKGLENIHGGILKDSNGVIHIPPKGATLYTCQTSTDYKFRTPIVKVEGVW